jgi:uncharacterized OB-fold protein
MSGLNPARLTREFPARYRLAGARCRACGEVVTPPRAVCPACRGRELEPHTVSDHGEVLTYTVIRVAGPGFVHEVPYVLAAIALDGGGRITCQLTDLVDEEPRIGLRVRLEFRRIQEDGEAGVIAYGHKAVPA